MAPIMTTVATLIAVAIFVSLLVPSHALPNPCQYCAFCPHCEYAFLLNSDEMR